MAQLAWCIPNKAKVAALLTVTEMKTDDAALAAGDVLPR